jgi:hypothetical protein
MHTSEEGIAGMKFTTIIAIALFSVMMAAHVSAQTTETKKQQPKSTGSVQQAVDVYVCPMHPDVTAAAAGKCSKCGMALEKRSKSGDTVQSTGTKKEMKKEGDRKGCGEADRKGCGEADRKGCCEAGCEKN